MPYPGDFGPRGAQDALGDLRRALSGPTTLRFVSASGGALTFAFPVRKQSQSAVNSLAVVVNRPAGTRSSSLAVDFHVGDNPQCEQVP